MTTFQTNLKPSLSVQVSTLHRKFST